MAFTSTEIGTAMSDISKSFAITQAKYWLYIITDDTSTEPMLATGKSVGADFGMKDAYLTLSTGEKIQSPEFLKQSLETTPPSQQGSPFSGKSKVLIIGGVLFGK